MKKYFIYEDVKNKNYFLTKTNKCKHFGTLSGEFTGEITKLPVSADTSFAENIVVCLISGEHVLVSSFLLYDLGQTICTGCCSYFPAYLMKIDSDNNHFCASCFKELAPAMKAEFKSVQKRNAAKATADEDNSKNYFLCSGAVISHFKCEHSKPFKSGHLNDNDDYYMALLDFESVEAYYEANELLMDENNFWCRECVPGTMSVSGITLAGMKRNGVFYEIEEKLNLSSERNIAMILYNLSEKYNCTPIELVTKILR